MVKGKETQLKPQWLEVTRLTTIYHQTPYKIKNSMSTDRFSKTLQSFFLSTPENRKDGI